MKRIIIAAGALLMSGTAYAYAPDMAPDMAKAVKSIWADVKQDAVSSEAWMGTEKPLGYSATAFTSDKTGSKPGADDLLAGELGGPAKPAAMPAGSEYTGMGGPLDDGATDYPPCSRAVRDRCIQLYERGVTGR
jgi:hypothetical protein